MAETWTRSIADWPNKNILSTTLTLIHLYINLFEIVYIFDKNTYYRKIWKKKIFFKIFVFCVLQYPNVESDEYMHWHSNGTMVKALIIDIWTQFIHLLITYYLSKYPVFQF